MAERFSKYLYDFEAFLDVQKNLAPTTRRAYIYDIERFSNYLIGRLGRMPPPNKITTEQIVEYLEIHLSQKHEVKNAAISRAMASLRVFFEYCVTNGIVTDNPTQHLHNPKRPRKLPVFLTNNELAELFAAPDQSTAQGVRDHAILTTLAFTGMRLSELIGVDVDDVQLNLRTVKVLGKGAKERMIPLNELVVKALNNYLDVRPSSPPSKENAFFLTRLKKRFSGRGIENIVRKYVLKSGIKNIKISPHKLRHTFATLLHLKDVDLLEIQALMGHSSITSTQIYTHTNSQKLKRAVEKLDTDL